MVQRIVFCDFDGTITVEETFVAVLKEFSPHVSAQLIPQMITLREGVKRILESIPSSSYPQILEFTGNKAIRPGFGEFIDFLKVHSVPLVVVSGGLRGMVEVVMGNLVKQVEAIHAVDVDTSNQYLRVNSQFEGDTELVAKMQVMQQYSAGEKIAIGDSITDLNMALSTPVVFARDRLSQYLDQRHRHYIRWNDFLEIRDYLTSAWKRIQ